MSIYIPGTGFATQGPCPDGFHVPTKDEWDGVKTILTGLSITTVSDYSSKLHMPLASLRGCYQNTDIGTSYTEGYYWSSTHSSSNGYAWMFWLYNYSGFPQSYEQAISWGYNIRPFKDEFIIPDSGWTIISGTLGNAGIFRNQNDGLISITGNGTIGHTMADKNLGATTVRSSGDTLSESNAGKYYQRGNNHGFPGIGNSETFTTTTTKIDASTYGPGNSYDSSTYFYSNNATDLKWDSSNNANLWGGEDGNVSVSQEVQNIYIGEYKVIDCDFTTGDYGFTFYGRTTSAVNYGRDSNGLYLSATNYTAGAAWKIPSSIYSRGTIKKIEFKFYSTTAGCGGGISYQTDTQFSRIWTSGYSGATGFDNNWGTHSNTPVTTPAGGYTFTIDLENKLLSASFTNTTFSLSNNDVSTIRNYWSNGNLNILGVIPDNGSSTVTGYIQRATFYF